MNFVKQESLIKLNLLKLSAIYLCFFLIYGYLLLFLSYIKLYCVYTIF